MKAEHLALIRHNAAGAVREAEKLRALMNSAQTVMRTLDVHLSVLTIEPNEKTATTKKSQAQGNRNRRPSSKGRNGR
jgi:RNA-binding protein YlmH